MLKDQRKNCTDMASAGVVFSEPQSIDTGPTSPCTVPVATG